MIRIDRMWSRKSPVWCWLFSTNSKSPWFVVEAVVFKVWNSNWVFSKHVSVRNSRIYAPASFFSLPPRPQKFFMSYLDGGKEQSIGPSEHLVRLLFRKLATNMPCREQRRKNKSLSIWPKPRDTSIFTTQIQNFFSIFTNFRQEGEPRKYTSFW